MKKQVVLTEASLPIGRRSKYPKFLALAGWVIIGDGTFMGDKEGLGVGEGGQGGGGEGGRSQGVWDNRGMMGTIHNGRNGYGVR